MQVSEQIRFIENQDWVLYVLLAAALILAFVKYYFNKQFAKITHQEEFVDVRDNSFVFAAIINILFAALLALLIWQSINIEIPIDLNFNEPYAYMAIVFIALLGYLFVRFLLNSLLFLSLDNKSEFRTLIIRKAYFRFWETIGLWILALFYYYSPFQKDYIVGIGLIWVVAMLGLEYFYQFRKTGTGWSYSTYYFILYLCALEILPLIYVIKQWIEWEIN